ncbi:MAG TPA: FAD-binding oxidoreductase [Thermoleophilaceae bacterium]|nr:FAD-binding oxidoreductase [Thermoleophilaceae bacterium]
MSTSAASTRAARSPRERREGDAEANGGRTALASAAGSLPGEQESLDGGEPTLLTGWGRTAATLAALHRPEGADRVAEIVAGAGERGVIARGLGRSYGDPAQNAGGRVVSMLGVRAVRGFDVENGVITVGAGLSIGELGGLVTPFGWFPPVLPGTSQVTIGGAIAADVHGKNHHVEGSFCDHVLAFELVIPGGEPLTVTPATEPDVFAATAGGMGMTGVVTEATIRLLPVETDRVRVDTERASDLDDLMGRMERDEDYRYSVAWVDCLARGRRLGRSVLMRAEHATRAEVAGGDGARTTLDFSPPRALSAPPGVPSGVLSTATLRAFNEAYFRRAPRLERGRIESLNAYFRPLDVVADWNRLYGARGLLQYQLVVPFGAEGALRTVVARLAAERAPAFLAVLKRFGRGHGMLSFPMAGWTLTMDLPAGRAGLALFLDELDELIVKAGGRLYLAKDSRLRPELLEPMYPELARWREVQARLDPRGALRSDLGRRVGLVEGAPARAAR